MKFTIEQQDFNAALSRVVGTVQQKNLIPVLGNVLISASDGRISLTTSDLDIQVTTYVPANVETEGATTVSARLLNDIVKKLSKGKLVSFVASGGSATVSSGRSVLDLATLPEEDFPKIATEVYQSSFTTEQSEFKRLFDVTSFAMSTEEARYYLNGVYLHPFENKARAVSTDGHRLAQADSGIVSGDFAGIIVPSKTVGQIRALSIGESEEVIVSISETKIRADFGHTVIVSKVIDGSFPNYKRVIPSKLDKIATVDASDLKRAAELVALVSNERSKAVKISLATGLVSLEVNSGIEKGIEEVDASYDGPDFEIGINAKYLSDILMQCNGDNAIMHFGTSGDAMKIVPSDDDLVLFVAMPMRL